MAVIKVKHRHVCTHSTMIPSSPPFSVPQSTHIDRQSRCQRILTKAKSSNSAVEKQIVVSHMGTVNTGLGSTGIEWCDVGTMGGGGG